MVTPHTHRFAELVLLAIVTIVGCGGPTAPSSAQSSANPEAARAHLNALLMTMETYSVNKANIDWSSFRAQVIEAAGNAGTIPELRPAIELALRLLGDHESYYQRAGTLLGPAPIGGCSAAALTTPEVPETIGYVKVGPCDCQTDSSQAPARRLSSSSRDGPARAGRPGAPFGTPTCGHHHLQQPFSITDGATLFLVSGQHADRTKRRYGGSISPDEIVSDPREAVNRAIAWLLAGG